MNLILSRHTFTDISTMGKLQIVDSDKWWHSMEDVDRGFFMGMDLADMLKKKVYGETAIPYGTYEVAMLWSNHFGKMMPHLLDVPAFTNIMVHPLNEAKQSLGCIGVGKTAGLNFVGESKKAFAEFLPILESALATERAWIEIIKNPDMTRRTVWQPSNIYS